MAYLWVASFLWAFSFGLNERPIDRNIDFSNFVAFTRLVISFLLFLPFIRLQGLKPRQVIWLCAIGAVQFGIMYLA